MNKEDHILIYIHRLEEDIAFIEFYLEGSRSVTRGTSSTRELFGNIRKERQEELLQLRQQLEEARRQYYKAKPVQN